MAAEVPSLISAAVQSLYKPRRHAERRNRHSHASPPPRSFSLLAVLSDCSVAVHQGHLEVTIQLFFQDVVLGGEHLADLHEGFVPGLGNNEDGVDGHSQADRAEDQVTVRTCGDL